MTERVINMLHGEPAYWCPVCSQPHRVAVHKPFSNGAQWKWNGDFERPTFTPSVHTYYDKRALDAPEPKWRLERPGKVGTLEFDSPAEAEAAKPNDTWAVAPVPVEAGPAVVQVTLCHVHVTDGKIHVLSDSPRMGGVTQALEPWDAAKWERPS